MPPELLVTKNINVRLTRVHVTGSHLRCLLTTPVNGEISLSVYVEFLITGRTPPPFPEILENGAPFSPVTRLMFSSELWITVRSPFS